MPTFLKDNWFKLAIVILGVWFMLGLENGSFTMSVCNKEASTSRVGIQVLEEGCLRNFSF